MNVEDFTNPTGGDRPIHPEIAEDTEAAMPASELSKQGLLEAIDQQLERRVFREDGLSGQVSKGSDLRDADGNPLSIFRYESGRGNMIGWIIHSKRDPSGAKSRTNYEIRQIPDGLSVERFYHSFSDTHKRMPLLQREPQAAMKAIQDMVAESTVAIAAQEEERELGLTFASEKDVKEITGLIQGAVPSPHSHEDFTFLRREQHTQKIAGRTHADEAGREPDTAQTELMAHAMNLDMAQAAEEASNSNATEDIIAELEAQAERKAAEAKAAYEQGVRSLAEVFGADSREGMAEQGWRWLTNITKSTGGGSFHDDFNPEQYINELSQEYGSENVTTRQAYNIHDRPVGGMIGVFVKQDAWHPIQ